MWRGALAGCDVLLADVQIITSSVEPEYNVCFHLLFAQLSPRRLNLLLYQLNCFLHSWVDQGDSPRPIFPFCTKVAVTQRKRISLHVFVRAVTDCTICTTAAHTQETM